MTRPGPEHEPTPDGPRPVPHRRVLRRDDQMVAEVIWHPGGTRDEYEALLRLLFGPRPGDEGRAVADPSDTAGPDADADDDAAA